MTRDIDRLRSYFTLITQSDGGPEAVVETLRTRPSQADATELEAAPRGRGKANTAQRAIESLAIGQDLSDEQYSAAEAIINAELRPAIDIINGGFTATHRLWRKLSDDQTLSARIKAVIPSVGRIELPGNTQYPYGGTGFIVGPGLLMTNRHVAAIFTNGLGNRDLKFISGGKAGIDFLRERGIPTGPTLSVTRIVMVHPYWDLAILAVEGLGQRRPPLRLSLTDARELAGHEIFVIGYPAFDPRNPAAVQRDLFGGTYGVKRLQPGQLQGGMKTSSFGKLVPAATHDCSTLGGNSGSAVFDLETGDVLALHFGGLYQQQNYGVPSSALAQDSRVVDAGVSFAGQAIGDPNGWADWWRRADYPEENVGPVAQPPAGIAVPAEPSPAVGPAHTVAAAVGNGIRIDIPLSITITIGAPAFAASSVPGQRPVMAASATEDMTEALHAPVHDTDYTSRKGYDPDFLNEAGVPPLVALAVPLPTAADIPNLAKTKAGGDVLVYQNFSVRMHAKRRLALITASNVTRASSLRRPEPGKDYSRRGLSGLGPNDKERWFIDPRLDEAMQLPEVFFTKDRGAFDKGHLARRDDIIWGASYADLKRANGDSFHVTNCAPQVGTFNQSSKGEDNWGDLENHVLSEAANERLCVFAGPVLAEDDETFVGVGEGRTLLRAKIPTRFWKVIVARVDEGIAAFGFVLEQDLSNVPLEFAVPANFLPTMTAISEIEAIAGIAFDPKIRAADQFETVRGVEIAQRSGVRRREPGG